MKEATTDNLEVERIDSDQNKKDSSEESIFEEVISERTLEKHSVYLGISLTGIYGEGNGDSFGYSNPNGFGLYTFSYGGIHIPTDKEDETDDKGGGYGYVITYRKNLLDNYFMFGLGTFISNGFSIGNTNYKKTYRLQLGWINWILLPN